MFKFSLDQLSLIPNFNLSLITEVFDILGQKGNNSKKKPQNINVMPSVPVGATTGKVIIDFQGCSEFDITL